MMDPLSCPFIKRNLWYEHRMVILKQGTVFNPCWFVPIDEISRLRAKKTKRQNGQCLNFLHENNKRTESTWFVKELIDKRRRRMRYVFACEFGGNINWVVFESREYQSSNASPTGGVEHRKKEKWCDVPSDYNKFENVTYVHERWGRQCLDFLSQCWDSILISIRGCSEDVSGSMDHEGQQRAG
jgi:hypothetical protein